MPTSHEEPSFLKKPRASCPIVIVRWQCRAAINLPATIALFGYDQGSILKSRRMVAWSDGRLGGA
jgi:hypothetical protein